MNKKETIVVFAVIAFAVFVGSFFAGKSQAPSLAGIETNRLEGNTTETEKLLTVASSSVILQADPSRSYLSCSNFSGTAKPVFLRFGTGNATFNTGLAIPASSAREFDPKTIGFIGRVAAISGATASVSCTTF